MTQRNSYFILINIEISIINGNRSVTRSNSGSSVIKRDMEKGEKEQLHSITSNEEII